MTELSIYDKLLVTWIDSYMKKAKKSIKKDKSALPPMKESFRLQGSLNSSVQLNDYELKNTRKAFTQSWPRKV